MASSIIHLAITSELEKICEFNDLERLRLGTIFPDSGCGGCNSHLKISVCGNHKKTYDLEYFRDRYGNEMLQDDFYLGYYLHLIQDIVYRKFVYKDHHWNPMIPGNVEKLHRDYEICNQYVIEKYSLAKDMIHEINLNEEPINEIGSFDRNRLLSDFSKYFIPVNYDDTFFFTKEMADEFIQQAVDICISEINAVRNGEKYIDSYDWAWDNMPRSLLETTLNTRDLGGYRSTSNGVLLRNWMILRSDVQNYPSDNDVSFLKNRNILTIIDMRGEKDIQRKPSGFENREGFFYNNIQIDEGSGVPESPEYVSESYMKIAESKNMPEVFRTIANAPGGVMFNCSAGKDRSGVVSAILLWLCGVSREDIIYDYMITKICNKERFELLHKNFPEIDMNIVIPREDYMKDFLKSMKIKYKDATGYLKEIGLEDNEIKKINGKLL